MFFPLSGTRCPPGAGFLFFSRNFFYPDTDFFWKTILYGKIKREERIKKVSVLSTLWNKVPPRHWFPLFLVNFLIQTLTIIIIIIIWKTISYGKIKKELKSKYPFHSREQGALQVLVPFFSHEFLIQTLTIIINGTKSRMER